jgi:peptidoglycan-associated lipoprotein
VSTQARVTGTPAPVSTTTTETPQVDETDQGLNVEQIFKNEIQDIFFDFDRAEVTAEYRDILRQNAEVLLRRLPRVSMMIEGHCDERGTEEYNIGLGDKRANAARDYLVSLGVSATRIKTISYGEERPFDPAHNEEAWAKNRRAHFVLIKP